MRINLYSQEMTDEFEVVEKTADTGIVYSGIRFFLHSTDRLHHRLEDDDRSAVTIWLPKSASRRETIAALFENMAHCIRGARPETGAD